MVGTERLCGEILAPAMKCTFSGGCISDFGRRAFTAEGAETAEKIEKKRSFLPIVLFSAFSAVKRSFPKFDTRPSRAVCIDTGAKVTYDERMLMVLRLVCLLVVLPVARFKSS
jgi:hypothetical protein